MKITFDVEEIFPEDDGWARSSAETIRHEVAGTIIGLTRKLVTDIFREESKALSEQIREQITRAILLAAKEIEDMDDDALFREFVDKI